LPACVSAQPRDLWTFSLLPGLILGLSAACPQRPSVLENWRRGRWEQERKGKVSRGRGVEMDRVKTLEDEMMQGGHDGMMEGGDDGMWQ